MTPTSSDPPFCADSYAPDAGDQARYCTTVGLMVYWSACRLTWSANSSRYSTQQLVLSTDWGPVTTSLMHSSAFTGCGSESARENKLAVLTYNKVLHWGAPSCLGSLIRVADLRGRRARRSAGPNSLVVPLVELSTVGSRAFPIAAANSGTACRMTSFLMIRCRPFGVNSNIICSSSPVLILFCNCFFLKNCSTVLLRHH